VRVFIQNEKESLPYTVVTEQKFLINISHINTLYYIVLCFIIKNTKSKNIRSYTLLYRVFYIKKQETLVIWKSIKKF
jgi:hypothetical protein